MSVYRNAGGTTTANLNGTAGVSRLDLVPNRAGGYPGTVTLVLGSAGRFTNNQMAITGSAGVSTLVLGGNESVGSIEAPRQNPWVKKGLECGPSTGISEPLWADCYRQRLSSSDGSASTRARRLAVRPATSRFPSRAAKPGVRRRFAASKHRPSGGPWRERCILRRHAVKMRLLRQPLSRSHRRMHLKSILNRVEPLKSFVYKEQRLIESEGGQPFLEVDIEPRANGRPICGTC